MARKEGEPSASGDLGALAALLDQAAEKAPARAGSAYEQVQALLPKIDALFSKRYTRAEVRDLLAQGGLEMSLGTFSQYYAKAKREAEGIDNGPDTATGTRREPKVKANANKSPKPSELAGAAPRTSGEGTKALGHKLNSDDV